MSVAENITNVKFQIEEAKKRSPYGQEVTLIAVSKTHPAELVMQAYDAGIRDFGENKVQELTAKYEDLPKDIRWHLIGHLQTNKVKQVVGKAYMIHSVDSLHLAEKIDADAKATEIKVKIVIEVNVAEEDSKFGITCAQAPDFAKQLAGLENLEVCGLMTVAPYTENAEENRRFFSALRKLSIDINEMNIDNINMKFLSMGMSGDYPVAIEEGSNLVRIGTSIFGEREYLFS